MTIDPTVPVIFTPSDEPYLGRAPLHAFDKAISAALALNETVAPRTHSNELTELQRALCQLIPSALSICLSIRELIRQGYLYGALVLLRPLAERVVTAIYLHQRPENLAIWNAGWAHKQRPGFNRMIRDLWGEEFPGVDSSISQSLNSLIHGDPESAKWNLVLGETGSPAYAVSKILQCPDLCDRAALEAAYWLAEIMGLLLEVFIDAKESKS